jgi:2-polyprenyl-3-methyl-5-hydroxy-6-metoxy-1,4-benzoquinol methylase
MGDCLFCNSGKYTDSYYPDFTFNNKKFRYVTCANCQLTYIHPSLDNDDLNRLYSIDYHNEFYFTPKNHDHQQALLLKQFKPSGRLLDYGCGDGSFLHFFKGKDYSLFGAEYNPKLVQKLNQHHTGISFFTINDILTSDDHQFDIIHLGDVLEHLVNPAEVIKTLRKRLAPGGVLFVEGPVEHNFHVALFFRKIFFRLRKAVQPRRMVAIRPFHVFFSNQKNQLSFFKSLRYQTRHYQLFEWAWPFIDRWQEAKSLRQKGEYMVASLSIACSRLVNGWGNRFYYIGTPTKEEA